ncbi:MAG: hypothetical protein QM820_03750 [Minicystis sp.]
MSEHVIHAELFVRGCTAELYVNGIPLRRNVWPVKPFVSIPVHQYLVPGDNRIELLVEPGPTPSRAREAAVMRRMPGAAAAARLVRYEEGEFTDVEYGEQLAEVAWEGEADTDEVFAKSLGATAGLGERSGRWSWQDAAPIVLDDATRAEIAHVLGTIAQAFERGDPGPVLSLLKVRFEEGIRAYPVNDEATLTKELTAYVHEVANEGWKVRRLEPEAFSFRLCAGDRLVELVDKDWLPSLRFFAPDDEEPYGYALMLARIEGRLVVVR